MRLLPPRPITIGYLRDLFATLKIPATITVIERDAIVEAKSAEINSGQIENIKYLLNIYLPANMIYEIRVALNRAEISNDFKVGLGNWLKATTAVQANVSQFIN